MELGDSAWFGRFARAIGDKLIVVPHSAPSPSRDTHPEADRWLLERLRSLDPAERLRQVFGMIEFGFQLETSGLRLREPELTGIAFDQRVAVIRFGRELGGKVAEALAERAERADG